MVRIIVTGGGGLLGRHLVPMLEGQGDEVIAVGRPDVDLGRPLDLDRLPDRADAIVYLAQSRRFRDFPDGAGDMFQVNVARVAELLDYARHHGVTNFVYASTGGVYAPSDAPLSEDSALASPMGYYPASKRSAELLAQCYGSLMNVAILRYFFIYGSGQQENMLVPRLVESVRNGRAIGLQGRDGLRLSPVHASDAARATAAAARLGQSAIINVAGPESLSLREMGEAIADHAPREAQFNVQDRSGPVDYMADTSRMNALLGAPASRFRDKVRELVRS